MLKFIVKVWKLIANISLVVILITLGLDMFAPLSEYQRELIHEIDLVAVAVLFLDFLFHLYHADDKIKHLSENWLLALSFIPYASVFYPFQTLEMIKLKLTALLKGIKVFYHHFPAIEAAGAQLLGKLSLLSAKYVDYKSHFMEVPVVQPQPNTKTKGSSRKLKKEKISISAHKNKGR